MSHVLSTPTQINTAGAIVWMIVFAAIRRRGIITSALIIHDSFSLYSFILMQMLSWFFPLRHTMNGNILINVWLLLLGSGDVCVLSFCVIFITANMICNHIHNIVLVTCNERLLQAINKLESAQAFCHRCPLK